MSKQILSAAKRHSKKRTSSSAETTSPRAKRAKNALPLSGTQLSPAEFEASLALPTLDLSSEALEQEINATVLHTNRAPIVVAFVVQMLKYTMPSQPLSSRLSLAQAVMSQGAQSKALNIGLKSGKSAETEGWGEGQPKIRVMGQQLHVMRRSGYDCHDNGTHEEATNEQAVKQAKEKPEEKDVPANIEEAHSLRADEFDSQETIKGDPISPPPSSSSLTADTKPQKQGQQPHQSPEPSIDPPLWALDLEKLRSTSTTTTTTTTNHNTPNLPIHSPHSARTYLLKSFATAPTPTPTPTTSTTPPSDPKTEKPKKPNKALKDPEAKEKEHNLALLLHALDLLFSSWIDTLGPEELDRRAWGWYVRVRPRVEAGRDGWGGRGEVRLGEVLGLRR
ncbi:MAG: hypothetical protein LQ350_006591 [Teloschistes chrysophthalmus]|nr:MAG: hypothetical protein LQ350_006591 [Niorma chrysophthalma]